MSLSPAKSRFLAAVRAAGPAGLRSPDTSNRASVTLASAWHRTADALERAHLITTTHNGSTRRAWLAPTEEVTPVDCS